MYKNILDSEWSDECINFITVCFFHLLWIVKMLRLSTFTKMNVLYNFEVKGKNELVLSSIIRNNKKKLGILPKISF